MKTLISDDVRHATRVIRASYDHCPIPSARRNGRSNRRDAPSLSVHVDNRTIGNNAYGLVHKRLAERNTSALHKPARVRIRALDTPVPDG
jgi:hypothetical protein